MYFRQAQAAPTSLPEFKDNVVAVQTAPYWDDTLDSLHERWEKLNEKLDQEAKKRTKATQDEKDAAHKKAIAETFTPEELRRLKGVSNGGYHYLGTAKILAPIGKAFAEAMLNVQKTRDRSKPEPKKPVEQPGPTKTDAAGDPLPRSAVSRPGTRIARSRCGKLPPVKSGHASAESDLGASARSAGNHLGVHVGQPCSSASRSASRFRRTATCWTPGTMRVESNCSI